MYLSEKQMLTDSHFIEKHNVKYCLMLYEKY